MNIKSINFRIIALFSCFGFLFSCQQIQCQSDIKSPDNKLNVTVKTVGGELFYSVYKNNQPILLDSKLGFELKEQGDLSSKLEVMRTQTGSYDDTWEQPWGESHFVRNHYNEMKLFVQQDNKLKRQFVVVFRVFNDGIGFRYEFPKQENLNEFTISKEITEFHFAKAQKGWWMPAYKEPFYESIARFTPIEKMDTVTTPVTFELEGGKYITLHEANLTDYAKMNLYPTNATTLSCDLSPWSNGDKVYAKTPSVTPWRTMVVAENINELVTSNIMLNLNEPSKIEDTSWLKPNVYIGIWWDIHLGKYTWSSGPKHGATTANTKQYIDFAAKNGIKGVLVEGWNVGWDGDWTQNGPTLDFTKSYPDFDIKAITDYAKSKNVSLIGHHETAGSAKHYEDQLDQAFAFYQKYGVSVVKTGYVQPLLEGKEYHDGQYAVRHYRKVIETAAKYKIAIDNHEPVMPTGLQRTYPNLMTQEGIRGQEYDAWSKDGGNPPSHTTIMPFLRGLAGPMDFTPGTFNFANPAVPGTRVQTTIAKQLALYVVIYSPLQMASDAPDNYAGQKAFDFIKGFPCDWEKTVVPAAKIGDYAIFARKARNGSDWFVGAITNEKSRELDLPLSFLDKKATYVAQIYADGKDADWKTNPTAMKYEERTVRSSDILHLQLATSGGCAIKFIKK